MRRQNQIVRCQRVCLNLLAVFVWITAPQLLAQQQFGSITGLVTDPSGAVVPGAAVVITNVNTGVSSALKTNAEGYYTATSLIPGTYDISVSVTGFDSVTRRGITLDVAQDARIDIALIVGTTAQHIEVQGRSPLLQTEAATVGQVVPQTAVNQLPLNGRN